MANMTVDPITLSVLQNGLMQVCNEMDLAFVRSAFSPVIAEALDRSDGIYHRELTNLGPVWEQGKVWREQNPIRYAAKFKTPALVSVGEHDFRVPINNALEYWSALQRQRVESKLIVFPDENHWVLNAENSKFWYGEVQAWLARWLKDEKPASS